MAQATSDAARLEATVLREAEAARTLGAVLAEARTAMERLDLTGFHAALEKAARVAEELRQTGLSCNALAKRAAAQANLPEGSRLSEVGRRLPSGEALRERVEELRRELDQLYAETGALGIGVRYGSRLCAHLVGLHRGALNAGYDVRGQLTQSAGTKTHRA